MKFLPNTYITAIDPLEGDSDYTAYRESVTFSKLKKERTCHWSLIDGDPHTIKAGEMSRVQKGLYDGEWTRMDICTSCMDDWLIELSYEPEINEATQ